MKLNISTGERTLLIILGSIIAIVLAILFWYVMIPTYVIVFIWAKSHLERKKKWQITKVSLAIMVVLTSVMFYIHRPPTITIKEPGNNITVQKDTTQILGFVSPKEASLKINGLEINKNNGEFTRQISLNEGENTIKIVAKTWFTKNVVLIVKRELTQEEKDAKDQAEAERIKTKLEANTKIKAEREVWESSPAGKACETHPGWTKEECNNLMAGKIWIGMRYKMLVYRWGKPDHTNLSNYGYGSEYQYCWDDYTPGCFYDNNDDGIIDAYN